MTSGVAPFCPPSKGSGIQYCPTHIDRNVVRGGTLRPSPGQLCIGSWNVEGLTEAKIVTLETYMQDHGIHLLCLQEVRKPMSEYYITDAGFLLISSGGTETQEHAGVVFLVHPCLRNHIYNFCPYSNRLLV